MKEGGRIGGEITFTKATHPRTACRLLCSPVCRCSWRTWPCSGTRRRCGNHQSPPRTRPHLHIQTRKVMVKVSLFVPYGKSTVRPAGSAHPCAEFVQRVNRDCKLSSIICSWHFTEPLKLEGTLWSTETQYTLWWVEPSSLVKKNSNVSHCNVILFFN